MTAKDLEAILLVSTQIVLLIQEKAEVDEEQLSKIIRFLHQHEDPIHEKLVKITLFIYARMQLFLLTQEKGTEVNIAPEDIKLFVQRGVEELAIKYVCEA